MVRGQSQTLRLYGVKTGTPVVVSSGDGGFVHLAPVVAEFLASKGYFVVGDIRSGPNWPGFVAVGKYMKPDGSRRNPPASRVA